MPARLSVHLPEAPVRELLLEEGREYVVGRDAGCEMTVGDPRVSRRHARFAWDGERWCLADLGSKNGTRRAGEAAPRRTGGDEGTRAGLALASGDWIDLGGIPARFDLVAPETLRRDRERVLARWRRTRDVQSRIDPAVGLPALLPRILDSVLEVSRAERAFVLLRGARGELEVAGALGLDADELASAEFSGSVSAVERVLTSGAPLALAEVRGDRGLAAQPSIVAGGVEALVCLPLSAAGRRLGALYADSSRPGTAFTELDVAILESLASHAALALAVARVHHDLEELGGGAVSERWCEPGAAGLAGIPWRQVRERSSALRPSPVPDGGGDAEGAPASAEHVG